MPRGLITLTLNSNHAQKKTAFFDGDDSTVTAELRQLSRAKLRVGATRFFLPGGAEVADGDGAAAALLAARTAFVSTGENFVGARDSADAEHRNQRRGNQLGESRTKPPSKQQMQTATNTIQQKLPAEVEQPNRHHALSFPDVM